MVGDAQSALLPGLGTDDLRLLVDLGFTALMRGQIETAGTLFNGVAAARPDLEAGMIGQALVMLARNEVDAAVAQLRKAPPSDDVMAFLGMALARQGDKAEARRVLALIEALPAPAEGEAATGLIGAAALARQILAELGAA